MPDQLVLPTGGEGESVPLTRAPPVVGQRCRSVVARAGGGTHVSVLDEHVVVCVAGGAVAACHTDGRIPGCGVHRNTQPSHDRHAKVDREAALLPPVVGLRDRHALG